MKIAILVIAAGSSSRLGQPKQLVSYQQTFLLDYIIQQCEKSEIGDVFVVLGANRELIRSKISNSNIRLLYNPNWSEGMSTSIACGVSVLQPLSYDGVVVMLGDQPFFESSILINLLQKQQATKARVLVSRYDKGMGPPSFFDKTLFGELVLLKGDVGAKPIIRKYFDEIERINFPKGHIDIDVPEDLEILKIKDN